MVILSPAGGGAFSQSATALANFSTTADYESTGSDRPTYATPLADQQRDHRRLAVSVGLDRRPRPGRGFNAVTAVLMADRVTNEYVLDAGSKSQTTWIMTFPTKYAYVNGTGCSVRAVHAERTSPRSARARTSTASCSTAKKVRRRSSRTTDFSPTAWPGAGSAPLLGSAERRLRDEQRVRFGQPQHDRDADTPTAGRCSASTARPIRPSTRWPRRRDKPRPSTSWTGGLTAGQPVTYFGLPVVGFAAETFQNDASPSTARRTCRRSVQRSRTTSDE